MPRKHTSIKRTAAKPPAAPAARAGRPSALLDTRIDYCGGCLEQLHELPDDCVGLIYIDPPFNSNRNHGVLCGKRPAPSGQASEGLGCSTAATPVRRLKAMSPKIPRSWLVDDLA